MRANRTPIHVVISICALMLAPRTVLGWGDIGHSTVGEIAERNLTEEGRAFVYDLMGPEPMAVSAVFPDLVRSDDRFKNFARFHFLEIPAGLSFEAMSASQRGIGDADTIISQVPKLLLEKQGLSQDQKRMLFRYLVHVVGDVHQPLHVGNGVDMGANLCNVRWENPESGQMQLENLHTVWDEKLIQNTAFEFAKAAKFKKKRYFGYREFTEIILKEGGLTIEQVSAEKPSTWYQESRALHSVVYPDAAPVASPEERPYCKRVEKTDKGTRVVDGKYSDEAVPTLSKEYVMRSTALIKKQILLGGLRLAALINRMAKSEGAGAASASGTTKASEQAFLQGILLENPGRSPQSVAKGASKKAPPLDPFADWCDH